MRAHRQSSRWRRGWYLAALVPILAAAPCALPAAPAGATTAPRPAKRIAPTPEQMKRGREVFDHICFACHQLNGRGLPGVYPPLAGSKILLNQRQRVISILLQGLHGPVKVRGSTYNNVMPDLHLSDQQIADVMTYALNSFGNKGGAVTVALVDAEHKRMSGHAGSGRTRSSPGSGGGMMSGGTMMDGHGMMRDH